MSTDQALWKAVKAFDLDKPLGEYSFSIRLKYENKWTENFTQLAILEYKKFMYLAATCNAMVSPSEIVDQVWHLHLIYTENYKAFCGVLGQNIQHIPSTHNRSEKSKFLEAKNRTEQCYKKEFGEQPEAIWKHYSMMDSLPFKEMKMSNGWVLFFVFLLALLLSHPLSLALRSFFMHVYGMAFLKYFLPASVACYIIFRVYTNLYIQRLFASLTQSSFLKNLTPWEVMYVHKGKLSNVVHGVLSKLYAKKFFELSDSNMIKGSFLIKKKPKTSIESAVKEEVEGNSDITYEQLTGALELKPVFLAQITFFTELKNRFDESTHKIKFSVISACIFSLGLMFGASRLIMGIQNNKPVTFLVVLLLIYMYIAVNAIVGANKRLLRKAVADMYKKEKLMEHTEELHADWQFYYLGTAALSASLMPFLNDAEIKNFDSGSFGGGSSWYSGGASSSCGGASCGSSCGSSCGGGCGGCGGS